jgi:hypothetical protein
LKAISAVGEQRTKLCFQIFAVRSMTVSSTVPFLSLPDCPNHLALLAEADRIEYLGLRDRFHDELAKSKKGERLESFTDRLKKIRRFIDRQDEHDWKRSLVCGVVFLPDGLALNIQQLRILLGRCKSSINGSLQQLGYTSEPQTQTTSQDFLMKIPAGYHNTADLKKWTIRRNPAASVEILPRSPFLIPLPSLWTPPAAPATNTMQQVLQTRFPCPVKCRYKYHEMLYQSAAAQTEA